LCDVGRVAFYIQTVLNYETLHKEM